MNQWSIEVSEAEFEAAVLDRSNEVPVLVDFWAPWCGPCKALSPILEKLAEEYAGDFILAKVNVDDNPNLAAVLGVQGIPAVKLLRNGQLASEFTGALPEPMVREFLAKFLPSAADKQAAQAEKLEEEGKVSEAKAIYESILRSEANHARALLGLGRILMSESDNEAALEHLERVSLIAEERKEADRLIALLKLQAGGDQNVAALKAAVAANPDDLEARFNLAQALAASQKYEDALKEFLTIVKTDRGFQDDGARKAMIQIFEVLGSDHPLTDKYRSALAAALFR